MKKAHANPNSAKWIISLVVMLILSAAIIVGTTVISKTADAKAKESIDVGFLVTSTQSISVEENELNVTGVEKAFDNSGEMVGYVVKTNMTGYNQEVPIEQATTVTKDGKIVVGIEIIKQEETEYLGVRIQSDDFKNQFNGKKLPIAGTGIQKGSKVDLLANSTISSQAVVDAVNNSAEYVSTFLAE